MPPRPATPLPTPSLSSIRRFGNSFIRWLGDSGFVNGYLVLRGLDAPSACPCALALALVLVVVLDFVDSPIRGFGIREWGLGPSGCPCALVLVLVLVLAPPAGFGRAAALRP